MAKSKGNRIQIILECTEHKASGMPGYFSLRFAKES